MEVTFERELNGAWLLLSEEEAGEEYVCRLLERNPGRHWLRLSRRYTGEGVTYAFAIPGGNSLAGQFRLRAISFPEIRKIMLGLAQAVEEAEGTLLPLEHLLLDPELIFCLPDPDHLKFCCHPGVKRDFFEELKKLIRYFMQKMDHQDTEGMETLYRLFEISEQEFFRFEDLMEEIGRAGRKEAPAAGSPTPEPDGYRIQERSSQPEEEQTSETGLLRPLILLLAGVLTGALALLLRAKQFFWDWRILLIPCCLLASSFALLLRILLSAAGKHKAREKKPDARRKPRRRESKETEEAPATELLGEPTVLSTDGSLAMGFAQLIPQEAGVGEAALLRHYPFVIGKLKGETDLMINLPSISRLHAKIQRREGQLSIMDCRSTNGTWVNGIRLEPETDYPLQPGDEIRFADVRYRLE